MICYNFHISFRENLLIGGYLAMLITELNFTHKKALAKEIRCFVEPDKAQTTRIIREAELRKFFAQKELTMHGISDVEIILKSNYNEKTISRILSKIQKPIVLDTCLCNLNEAKMEELILNSDCGFIITTKVYKEIIKLSSGDPTINSSVQTAQKLLNLILEDSESNYCSIVDIPLNDSDGYVDNQLLAFCKKNDYTLYTYDYTCGLRAKARGINVQIFTAFNKATKRKYVPDPTGKNIILSKDILRRMRANNIIEIATELGANKFILTKEFVDYIEELKDDCLISDWIQFFVADENNDYLIFTQSYSENSLLNFANNNNAIFLSADLYNCMNYKMNFVPYIFIDNSSKKKLVSNNRFNAIRIKKTTDKSTELTSNDSLSHEKIETNKDNNESSKEIAATAKSTTTKLLTNTAIIPHYKPRGHVLSLANLHTNEDMFVIDQFGEVVNPNIKKEIILQPKYRVVYFLKSETRGSKSLKLTVFNVLNSNTSKYGSAIFATYFDKNDLSEIPLEYHSFAKRTVL